jgi:hypothetical protein
MAAAEEAAMVAAAVVAVMAAAAVVVVVAMAAADEATNFREKRSFRRPLFCFRDGCDKGVIRSTCCTDTATKEIALCLTNQIHETRAGALKILIFHPFAGIRQARWLVPLSAALPGPSAPS